MPSDQPKFSVVLPVRNGGEYVKLCVASILAQTVADRFDLLILDNVSTDGTAEWLASLPDSRVRLYPAERPLSIEANWARIKEIPKHEFLTMIGHDDLLDPDFLATISQLISEHPAASLYQTHFRLIDSRGEFQRRCQPMPAHETADEFLAARLCRIRDSYGTGYVLRSADYDAVGGIPDYHKLLYADDALFLQITGRAYKATALAEKFSYRLHPGNASNTCVGYETFHAFERYRDLLRDLQATNGAIREVLRRHFASHAVSVAYWWLSEERLAAMRHRHPLDPQITRQIQDLITSFGEAPPVAAPGLLARVLERSADSSAYRLLYRVLAWQVAFRDSLRQFLVNTISTRR